MSTQNGNGTQSAAGTQRAVGTQRLYPEGLLGRKLGMTQVFGEAGEVIPVTVIQLGPCTILDIKNPDRDGYTAVQFGFQPMKPQRATKAQTGHFARAGKGAFKYVREMRCDTEALGWKELGQTVTVGDVFKGGELVDVSGVSIGRGFQGVVRRHHAKGQPLTRGTHEYRRHIGAIGMRKFPGRVMKGKRMPGQMGNENVTVQNLEVVGVRPDENVLLVRGGVPGAKGGLLVVRKARKGFGMPARAGSKAA